MKPVRSITLLLLIIVAGCSNHDSVEQATPSGDPSASITHEDGWTIVSKEVNGDHEYWFLAPDVNGASPAIFKKIITSRDKIQPGIKIINECDAPKRLCDELGARFELMSEKYQ